MHDSSHETPCREIHSAESAGGIIFRVVAYNFLTGGSEKRSGHWGRVVRTLTPDLILAQECRLPSESPGEKFRPDADDTLVWKPVSGRRWGSALLSRSVPLIPLRVPGFDGWVTGAETTGPSWSGLRRLRIFSIHGPVGENGYVRTMHLIIDRIARLRDGADLLLGGDFNVVVGYRRPEDIIKMSRGEKEILDRLSVDLDLVSCWQAAHPGRPLAQTLRWSANRSAPYHCDGIFVQSSWIRRLVSCRVVRGSRWNALSDHNPVVAEFSGRTTHTPG